MLANDIMASCYANVKSHEVAHFFMGPLRFYHWLARWLFISEPFGHQNIAGLHLLPKMMLEVTQSYYPSALELS